MLPIAYTIRYHNLPLVTSKQENNKMLVNHNEGKGKSDVKVIDIMHDQLHESSMHRKRGKGGGYLVVEVDINEIAFN